MAQYSLISVSYKEKYKCNHVFCKTSTVTGVLTDWSCSSVWCKTPHMIWSEPLLESHTVNRIIEDSQQHSFFSPLHLANSLPVFHSLPLLPHFVFPRLIPSSLACPQIFSPPLCPLSRTEGMNRLIITVRKLVQVWAPHSSTLLLPLPEKLFTSKLLKESWKVEERWTLWLSSSSSSSSP